MVLGVEDKPLATLVSYACHPEVIGPDQGMGGCLGCRCWTRKTTPGRIRTCDLRIRNPLLYPTELRAQLILL